MAELTPQERLQPSLLDRLTDDAPEERQESRERRVLSLKRLREAVLRDLSWLLNSGNLEQSQDLEPYPEVRTSVLNFGMPDLSGHHLSGTDVNAVEASIRRAVLAFEPRLLPNTVSIRGGANDVRWGQNSLTFEIEGTLWSQPVPQRLFLRTEVDLELGSVSVIEAS